MSSDDDRWLGEHARRNADLYDGYRVDHLVGFYRTYGRPRDGSPPFFTPSDEGEQLALGERLLDIFRRSGADIIAEDLGTVPDFVRESLARVGVPGFKVFRWERHWHTEGQPFRDPADYPAKSVAASGTHDTEPLVVWWQKAEDDERRKVSELPTIQRLTGGAGLLDAPYDPTVRDTLIEALFASRSDLVLFPVQDVFGWRDRINEPATVTDANWSAKLPWPCDRLDEVPEARERQQALRDWTLRHKRA
jgi:4-alpha-glucanotransferase